MASAWPFGRSPERVGAVMLKIRTLFVGLTSGRSLSAWTSKSRTGESFGDAKPRPSRSYDDQRPAPILPTSGQPNPKEEDEGPGSLRAMSRRWGGEKRSRSSEPSSGNMAPRRIPSTPGKSAPPGNPRRPQGGVSEGLRRGLDVSERRIEISSETACATCPWMLKGSLGRRR